MVGRDWVPARWIPFVGGKDMTVIQLGESRRRSVPGRTFTGRHRPTDAAATVLGPGSAATGVLTHPPRGQVRLC
jgi:hypothetical protein